jgi:NADPH:quinone reductase
VNETSTTVGLIPTLPLSLPTQMRALRHTGERGAVLCVERVAMPQPLSGVAQQVCIRVQAFGINRPDLLQRAGFYDPPMDANEGLGLEVAGQIVACIGLRAAEAHTSDGVSASSRCANSDAFVANLEVGLEVCALCHGGGYAEYVWVDARHCLPIPQGWSVAQAASLPETFFTVWFNVFMQGKLAGIGGVNSISHATRSDILLIHSAASGIGQAAIQIAKALNQTVAVTLRHMNKADLCRKWGADVVVAQDEHWVQSITTELMALNDTFAGVNVVLDMVGADTAAGNAQILATHGHWVWIAFLSGAKASIPIATVMKKQLTLTGAFLRPQHNDVKAMIAQQLRETVWPLLDSGRIEPTVSQIYSVDATDQAHECMRRGEQAGKLVVQW